MVSEKLSEKSSIGLKNQLRCNYIIGSQNRCQQPQTANNTGFCRHHGGITKAQKYSRNSEYQAKIDACLKELSEIKDLSQKPDFHELGPNRFKSENKKRVNIYNMDICNLVSHMFKTQELIELDCMDQLSNPLLEEKDRHTVRKDLQQVSITKLKILKETGVLSDKRFKPEDYEIEQGIIEALKIIEKFQEKNALNKIPEPQFKEWELSIADPPCADYVLYKKFHFFVCKVYAPKNDHQQHVANHALQIFKGPIKKAISPYLRAASNQVVAKYEQYYKD